MSPSEFEFLIHLIGKNLEKIQRSGKPFLFKKVWHWRYVSWHVVIRKLARSTFSKFPCSSHPACFFNFVKIHWVLWVPYYLFSFIMLDKFYDTLMSPLHFTVTETPQQTAQHYRFTPLFTRSTRNEKNGREADVGYLSHCTSIPAQAVTVSSLWCDGHIPTAHRKCPRRYRVTNFDYITWSRVPSTLSRHCVKVRGNVTSVHPLLWSWRNFFRCTVSSSVVQSVILLEIFNMLHNPSRTSRRLVIISFYYIS
jgi:hypothetical protein